MGTGPRRPHCSAMTQDRSPLPEDGLERADVDTALQAARHRHHPAVRLLGWASEIADQVQLTTLCSAVAAAGALRGERRLLRSGLRMLTAHLAANTVKRVVKRLYRRTRPNIALEEGRYDRGPGATEGGHERSFPSGHAAGAMAVAGVVARRHPALALPAYGLAGAIAVVQVPRAKHYPVDVVAGAVLGFAAAWAVNRAWDHFDGD